MRPLMRNSLGEGSRHLWENFRRYNYLFRMDKVLSERIWPAEFSFCLKILSPGESAMARPQRDQKISGTRQDGLSTGQQRHYLYVRRSHAHRSEKQLYPLHLI